MKTNTSINKNSFAQPSMVPTPDGADGWERMYPGYLLFSKENQEWEDGTFWFWNRMHFPNVELPFDTIVPEAVRIAIGQYNSRIFAIPPAYGLEQRILNGVVYFSAVPVTDEKYIKERERVFIERASYYYENWDEIYKKWLTKVDILTKDLLTLDVPSLQKIEDESVVKETKGYSQGFVLLDNYSKAINNMFLAYQYHCELLNLGYVADLNLFQFCKEAFPGIKDETISIMATGIDSILFRPDEELKKLANYAIELGIDNIFIENSEMDRGLQKLDEDDNGKHWLKMFRDIQDPWFYISNGTGVYHHERSWIDDISFPWNSIINYIKKIQQGENIERPLGQILLKRNNLIKEYRELLSDNDKEAFDRNIKLAHMVANYIEDHNFYIEHRHHTIFWNKMREFGEQLVKGGFISNVEDFFYLNRWEVGQALYELVATWATGAPARGSTYWKKEIADRKLIVESLKKWEPVPALGPVPDEIQEPFTIMLFGVTSKLAALWLESSVAATSKTNSTINGIAASSGFAEGKARVVFDISEINEIEEGEILVCPSTLPAWGPVFGMIKAAVSDIGGIMSHAAIVCREYGLPAVAGTGNATKIIKSGDWISVDGDKGIVTVIRRYPE